MTLHTPVYLTVSIFKTARRFRRDMVFCSYFLRKKFIKIRKRGNLEKGPLETVLLDETGMISAAPVGG